MPIKPIDKYDPPKNQTLGGILARLTTSENRSMGIGLQAATNTESSSKVPVTIGINRNNVLDHAGSLGGLDFDAADPVGGLSDTDTFLNEATVLKVPPETRRLIDSKVNGSDYMGHLDALKLAHGFWITDFGAVGDGVTDDSAAIQACLDAMSAGDTLVIPRGTFVLTAQLEITQSINIVGTGEGSIIDATGAPDQPIYIHGEKTATTTALSGNAAKDQAVIAVASAASFSADDYIRVESDAYHNDGGTATLAEIQEILSISVNNITCKSVLDDAYATANSSAIFLLTMIEGVRIKDIKILGRGTGGTDWGTIRIEKARRVLVQNVTIKDGYTMGITLNDVLDAQIRDCNINDCNQSGLGYGTQVTGACQDVTIYANNFFDCRHSVSVGGSDGVQRSIIIACNHVGWSSQAVGLLGGHDTYDGVKVIGNIVLHDGLGYAGSISTSFIGNDCYNDTCSNGCVYSNNRARHTIIQNNKLVMARANPCIDFREDDVQIIGNDITSNDYVIVGAYKLGNLNIKGNTINHTSTTKPAIRLGTAGASSNSFNLSITDNEIFARNNCLELFFDHANADDDLRGVRIEGNYFRPGAGDKGIFADAGAGDGTVQWITINNNEFANGYNSDATRGIDLEECTDVQIHGNSFRNYDYAIELDTCVDGSITGNQLVDCDDSFLLTSPTRIRVDDTNAGAEQALTTDSSTVNPWGSTEIDSTSNKVDCTLGSGTYIGQIKTIVMTEASNASDLTITNHERGDGLVITFSTVDQYMVLVWNGTEWHTLRSIDEQTYDYNVKDFGAIGNDTADDEAVIANAHTAATVSGGTMVFPPGTYKLSDDITFDSDVTLYFHPGAMLSIDTAKTVTINAKISDTLHQIFTGAGSIVLGAASCGVITPQMWGADATGNANSDDAIVACFAAANVSGIPVVFPPGIYLQIITTGYIADGIVVSGYGAKLYHPAVDVAYRVLYPRNGAIISGFEIEGGGNLPANSFGVSCQTGDAILKDIYVHEIPYDGIYIATTGSVVVQDSTLTTCYRNGIAAVEADSITLDRNVFTDNLSSVASIDIEPNSAKQVGRIALNDNELDSLSIYNIRNARTDGIVRNNKGTTLAVINTFGSLTLDGNDFTNVNINTETGLITGQAYGKTRILNALDNAENLLGKGARLPHANLADWSSTNGVWFIAHSDYTQVHNSGGTLTTISKQVTAKPSTQYSAGIYIQPKSVTVNTARLSITIAAGTPVTYYIVFNTPVSVEDIFHKTFMTFVTPADATTITYKIETNATAEWHYNIKKTWLCEGIVDDFPNNDISNRKFFTTIPTRGKWNVGDIAYKDDADFGEDRSWQVVSRIDTEMRVGASNTDTTMEVDDTTGILADDIIGVVQDDGITHWTTVASVTDGDTLELTAGVTDDVAIDNDVFTSRWAVNGRVFDENGNPVFSDTQILTADSSTVNPWGPTQIDSTSNKVDCTLGSGTYIGQIKTIVMTEASNASDVSVTAHVTSDPEIGIFSAVDETWVLLWTGTEWVTLYASCTI